MLGKNPKDNDDYIEEFIEKMDDVKLSSIHGRITQIVGMLIKAIVPHIKIGEICRIKRNEPPDLLAEVVGFSEEGIVFLSPLGEMKGIGPSSEVIPLNRPLQIPVGEELLGRILDGLGRPLDTAEKGPLQTTKTYPVMKAPPDPLKRQRVTKPISLGIRAIDGCLTTGFGQRVGIFSGAGVGKSTFLGMIARNAVADINVIALIGERGREVRDFIEKDLGEEGMKKSVIVVATSDQTSQLRLNAAYVATAIAEYFRDQGKSIIFMMDSVTRFARALREVGLAAGEPPTRGGYTPSVFSTLPKLLERTGNSEKGSITAYYTILVAGEDMNEPVADEVRSILDGHIILSSELAHKFHYPAIDVLASISRVMPDIISKDHLLLISKVKEVLAIYKKNELLIKIGEYKRGTDRSTDFALDYINAVNHFLKQGVHEKCSFEETLQLLKSLFK